MTRFGKLPRPVRDMGPAASARRPRPAASWGSVAILSLLLLGGFGAFVLRSPAPEADDAATASAAQTSAVETREGAEAAAAPADDPQVSGDVPSGGWVAASSETPAFHLDPLPQIAGTLALRGLMARPGVVEGVRHVSGGGRDDALTIGEADAPGSLLRLSLYRPGTEPQPGGSYFVDVARRAGEHGMSVVRFVPLPPVESRIGDLEIALARFDGQAGLRNCVTFRRTHAEPAVRLSGWICLDGDNVPAPESAACIVDAVRWDRAEETALATLLSGKGEARGACAAPAQSDLTSSIRPAGDNAGKSGRR